jgi:nitrogen fixation protein NifZ
MKSKSMIPPPFEIGQKVRVRKLIRNDGTFPGKDIGATLAKKEKSATSSVLGHFYKPPTSTRYIFSKPVILSAAKPKNSNSLRTFNESHVAP